jgi:colanic acid/amylovoran biosynthesis glycosyltransferase
VGHSVSPFLFSTGSWVYGQIRGLSRWHAAVVCKRRENADQFPWQDVTCRDDLGPLGRLAQSWGRARHGYMPSFRQALVARRARLLHSHFGSQGWTDLPLVEALGIPLVTSLYGADIWKLSRQGTWLERYRDLFSRGALFLVEGPAMRRRIVGMGCPPAKIRIHHLGVDLSDACLVLRALPSDGRVRVLTSGRAVEKKGFELALEAFALARRELPSLELSLMVLARSEGELARRARLEARVRELGLERAVDFPPPMPYADYRRALERYHLFFCPSRHASDGDAEGGAPVSLIDMSATGMPIVASRHCDIGQIVLDEATGLLHRENDAADAARALLELASHPERWEAYGRAGRSHVEREYDLAAQVVKLERIYDEVAGITPMLDAP